jgi:hypothetical protein
MSVRLAPVPTVEVADPMVVGEVTDLVEEEGSEGTKSLVIICARKSARQSGDS